MGTFKFRNPSSEAKHLISLILLFSKFKERRLCVPAKTLKSTILLFERSIVVMYLKFIITFGMLSKELFL